MHPAASLSRFLIIILLLQGCIYENNETYVVPLEPPDGSDAAISLQELNGATLYKPVTVNMKVQPSGKQHYEALIKSSFATLYDLTSATGDFSFVVDPGKFSNGENTLLVEVAYPSLSPSLAGQLGAEVVYLKLEVKFNVDLVPPASLPAPLVYIEDGKSMVEWQMPNKFNFSELILLRTYYKNDYDVLARDTIKIANLSTTKFHEAWYVGGLVRYRVDIKGYKFYIPGKETIFNVTPLTVTLDSLKNPPELSWDKSPLYNNSIQIFYQNPYIGYSPNTATTIQAYARLGQPAYVTLRIRPVNSTIYSSHAYEIPKKATLGIPVPSFYIAEYSPAQNSYFLLNDAVQKLYRINADTYQITGELSIPPYSRWIMSANGLYAYLHQDGEVLSRVDLNGMYISEQINLTSIVGVSNRGITSEATLSNDNLLAFGLDGTPNKYVVNLATKTIEWVKKDSYVNMPRISPDGQYLLRADTVYIKQNENWNTILGRVPGGIVYDMKFRQDTKQQLIVNRGLYEGGILFYDLTAPLDAEGFLQLVPTPPLFHYRIHFDRHTTSLMIVNESSSLGHAYIYDADTFEQTRDLGAIFDPQKTLYVNGHYFHGSGAVLP